MSSGFKGHQRDGRDLSDPVTWVPDRLNASEQGFGGHNGVSISPGSTVDAQYVGSVSVSEPEIVTLGCILYRQKSDEKGTNKRADLHGDWERCPDGAPRTRAVM